MANDKIGGEQLRLEAENARDRAESEQVNEKDRRLTEEIRVVDEAARREAEQLRGLAEASREIHEQHREELEQMRQEREEARHAAEAARESAEQARRAAKDARHATVEAVRATADILSANLEQMKYLEEMRRVFHDMKGLKLSARHETFESAEFLTFFLRFLNGFQLEQRRIAGSRVRVRWRKHESESPRRLRPCSASDNVEFPVQPRKGRLVIRAACCLNLISRLPFQTLLPTCAHLRTT